MKRGKNLAERKRGQAQRTLLPLTGEILFRHCDDPRSELWAVPHWLVEFHDEDGPGCPVGLVWVAVYPKEALGPTLLYILVADDWRCQGIGKKLLVACLERWPDLRITPTATDEGEKPLLSVKRSSTLGRWPDPLRL